MLENQKLFALLIDGDNVQIPLVPQLLQKITQYGKPILKKVYLNINSLAYWETIINDYSLHPVWVPNNTKGKNASDIALVIDAMELLCERPDLTEFCIVSSDGDFTQLAKHIVAKNKFVLGIGEDKTPKSFVNACSEFVYIPQMLNPAVALKKPVKISVQAPNAPDNVNNNPSFEMFFVQAYENAEKDKAGWVELNIIKAEMNSLTPDFEASGYQNGRRFAEKVQALAAAFPPGVIEIQEKLDNKPVIHFIRMDSDTLRFIEAYQQVPIRDKNGWVTLSAIGAELKKQAVYENGLSFRGVKKSQLLKVVAEIVQAYPKAIKVQKKGDGTAVTYFIRIKI
jgi:hypothetical protein